MVGKQATFFNSMVVRLLRNTYSSHHRIVSVSQRASAYVTGMGSMVTGHSECIIVKYFSIPHPFSAVTDSESMIDDALASD